MSNYYTTLQINVCADIVVIKAAYRALMKKYHPDLSNKSTPETEQIIQEINAAYEILSDDVKRKQYDSTLNQSEKTAYTNTDFDLNDYTEDWNIVIQYYPELKDIDAQLSKISTTLSFEFRAKLLDNKRFDSASDIADGIKLSWLTRYFGEDPQLRCRAEKLIEIGRRDIAKSLNKAIGCLGKGIKIEILFNGLKKEFPQDEELLGKLFSVNPLKIDCWDDIKAIMIANDIKFTMKGGFLCEAICFDHNGKHFEMVYDDAVFWMRINLI